MLKELKNTRIKPKKWLNKNCLEVLILFELLFNDTSTIVGHFVPSSREREKGIEKQVEENKNKNYSSRWVGVSMFYFFYSSNKNIKL